MISIRSLTLAATGSSPGGAAPSNLEGRDQQEQYREHGECPDQDAIEAIGAFIDLGGVPGHGDQKAAVLAKVDIAFDLAELLLFRSLDIASPGPGDIRRHAETFETGQARIPQGA